MATQYLVFGTLNQALTASSADWAVRILGHPILSNAVTRYLWQIRTSTAGTIGIISDNVPLSGLSSSEQASLVTSTNPVVASVLALPSSLVTIPNS